MESIGGPLERRFQEVSQEWAALNPAYGAAEEDRFAAVAAEARAIVEAGRWVSGPDDLLTIIGRQRFELFHSRLIAWLMTPTGKHGLGTLFLRELLSELWPDENWQLTGPIVIALESTRKGASGTSGDLLEARADVVVHTDSLELVIENKVDAGEQPSQCERLYWAWRDSAIETRWVYLTLTGRPPATASSPEALAAWRPLSYARVAKVLESSLDASDRGGTPWGRAAAVQYLATIQRQLGG